MNNPDSLSCFKPEYCETDEARIIYQTMVDLGTSNLIALRGKLEGQIEFEDLVDIYTSYSCPNKAVFECHLFRMFEDWKERQKVLAIDGGITRDTVQKVAEIDDMKLYSAKEIDACDELLQKVEMKFTGRESPSMIPTGFKLIDDMVEGFDKGELVFIAGSSGSGKTTLATNIAYNVAKRKKKVLFFSLEMREVEIYERLVKNIADVSNFTTMQQDKFDKVVRVARAIRERLPLVINDKNITFESMVAEMKTHKPNLVIIDHLNILTSGEKFKDNLMRLEYLTRRMKETAKELEIPIVCVCQLNRSSADRDTKRPTLSDLRGSGSIEQDANMVIGVYRPEYYLMQNKPDEDSKEYDKWEEKMLKYKGKAEVLIMKNRRGRTGNCEFIFEGSYYRFTEIANDRR